MNIWSSRCQRMFVIACQNWSTFATCGPTLETCVLHYWGALDNFNKLQKCDYIWLHVISDYHIFEFWIVELFMRRTETYVKNYSVILNTYLYTTYQYLEPKVQPAVLGESGHRCAEGFPRRLGRRADAIAPLSRAGAPGPARLQACRTPSSAVSTRIFTSMGVFAALIEIYKILQMRCQ